MYNLTVRYQKPPVDVGHIGITAELHHAAIGIKRESVLWLNADIGVNRKIIRRQNKTMCMVTDKGVAMSFSEYDASIEVPYTPAHNLMTILEGMKYALDKLDRVGKVAEVQIDPNILKLSVGDFKSEEEFKQGSQKTLIGVQQALYGGGSVYYMVSTGTYVVLIGDTPAIRQAHPEINKTLAGKGESKHAESLDDLIRNADDAIANLAKLGSTVS